MKKLYLFIFSFVFFSFWIFFFKNYFFWWIESELNKYIEENYIEPSIENIDNKSYLNSLEKDKIKVSLKSAYNLKFLYFPNSFSIEIIDYIKPFNLLLNSYYFDNKIDNLKIELHKKRIDVRWKMKNHSIKLFWVKEMSISEFLAVWTHEFSHFIDLYFLKKEVFTDISDYFYNISWQSTKVLKAGIQQSDFVSGYAMTNKYEDFAESLTYFILHNEDFIIKSQDSELLKAKYNFFTNYLFRKKEFIWTDFSIDNKISLYYRDITKIDISLENFLEFLKK